MLNLIRRPGRSRVAAALLLALTLLAPASASAHADLTASDPADKAEVPSPFAGPITLTFSEALPPNSHAELLDGTGATVADASVDADRMVISLSKPLAPGSYTVQWTTVSADKHVERGTFSFTVLEPTPAPPTDAPTATAAPSAAPTPPTPGASQIPGTASPQPVGSPGTNPSPTPAPDSAGTADVLIPIVAALVLVAVAGAWLLRRRSPPS